MRKIFSKKTMVGLAVIFALCIGMTGCFRDTKNPEINTINQFSLVNGMPVRIDEDSLAVEDWEEAVAVCQGFYYAVALDGQGQVYYIDQNEEVTMSVSEALSTWSDIVEIAVLFETIVGMKADGSCLSLNIAESK